MKSFNNTLKFIFAVMLIFSVGVNIKQMGQIREIDYQILKTREIFGGSEELLKGRTNTRYTIKAKIKRGDEDTFEVPLFDIYSGGQVGEDEEVSIVFFKLLTPDGKWFYRTRPERMVPSEWKSIEHIRDGYGLSEREVEEIFSLVNNIDGISIQLLDGTYLGGGCCLHGTNINTEITLGIDIKRLEHRLKKPENMNIRD